MEIYERDKKRTYSLEEIFEAYKKSLLFYEGVKLLTKSRTTNKIRIFIRKGTKCYLCNLEGLYFAKERKIFDKNRAWYFPPYVVDKDGKEVMITKDHLVSKANGGQNSAIGNLMPCCYICNSNKGKLEKFSKKNKI